VIRRGFWLGAGFGLGVAASVRARRSAAQLTPVALLERLRSEIEAAVTEGRHEMHTREAELRTLLATGAGRTRDPGQ
jgi:hypothetical protein